MTWPVSRLGSICHTTSGGTPSRSRREYFGGSIAWVKSGDLTDGTVMSCEETITEAGLGNSSAKLFPKGTVLIAMYGATVGKLGVLGMEAATNQAVCGITPSAQLDSQFLFYFLLFMRPNLIAMSMGGAQPNINQKILRELQITIPPLKTQRHIVDFLSRAEGIVRLRKEARAKAAEIIPTLFLDMFGDPAVNPKNWPIQTIGSVISSADYGSSTKASETGEGIPIIRMGNVAFDGSLSLNSIKYVVLPQNEVERYRLLPGDLLFNSFLLHTSRAIFAEVLKKK